MRKHARRQVILVDRKRISHERIGRGWTMRELAQRAGIAASSVSNIELGGRARAHTVYRLAAALDVPVLELITLERRA